MQNCPPVFWSELLYCPFIRVPTDVSIHALNLTLLKAGIMGVLSSLRDMVGMLVKHLLVFQFEVLNKTRNNNYVILSRLAILHRPDWTKHHVWYLTQFTKDCISFNVIIYICSFRYDFNYHFVSSYRPTSKKNRSEICTWRNDWYWLRHSVIPILIQMLTLIIRLRLVLIDCYTPMMPSYTVK